MCDGTCTLEEACVGVCGDGFVQSPNSLDQFEACDDGNSIDGDGCSSLCELEAPIFPHEEFGGKCIDTRLPAINTDELLPVRWQLNTVNTVDMTP